MPISALLGAIVLGVLYYVRVRLPKRRLWRLTKPTGLVVCASNVATRDTGVYYRPDTGIGEMRSLALAVKSLNKAYVRELDIKNILLSTDHLQERLENDLLLIGGPEHNKVTARFLKFVSDKQPIRQTSDTIIWRHKKMAGKWLEDDVLEYTSKSEDKSIIQDYGIVIRMQSPFTTEKRTVILLSGIHTYGTIAAAKYFTEDMQKGLRWLFRLRKPNLAALVSTQIIDDYTTNIELVQCELW